MPDTVAAKRARRWPRRVLAAAIALLLIGNGTALYLKQGPTELTVDDAVSRFRASASERDAGTGAPTADGAAAPDATTAADAGPGAAAPAATATGAGGPASLGPAGPAPASAGAKPVPAEGVYVYATSGYEETDALGGSRHDYPSQTTSTMRRAGCGWVERWEPLAERWDESHLCNEPDGVAIRTFKTYHQFFQRSQQQDYECPPGSHVGRDQWQPGSRWTWSCTSSFGTISTDVVHLGTEQLSVGGAAVTVEHLRYDSKMTGANRGTQVQERWVHRGTNLSVRIKTDIDIESDSPFGTVGYQEHYTITLTSLTPRR